MPPAVSNGESKERRKRANAILLGTNLAVGMAVFTFLGYYIDVRRGTGHFWTLCGMVLGLIYCAYEVWKVIREINSEDKSRGNREK